MAESMTLDEQVARIKRLSEYKRRVAPAKGHTELSGAAMLALSEERQTSARAVERGLPVTGWVTMPDRMKRPPWPCRSCGAPLILMRRGPNGWEGACGEEHKDG